MKKKIEIDNENVFYLALDMIIVGAAEVVAITSISSPKKAKALDNKIKDFLRLAGEDSAFTTKEAIAFAEHMGKLLSLFF